jgi:hypothetical protein
MMSSFTSGSEQASITSGHRAYPHSALIAVRPNKIGTALSGMCWNRGGGQPSNTVVTG